MMLERPSVAMAVDVETVHFQVAVDLTSGATEKAGELRDVALRQLEKTADLFTSGNGLPLPWSHISRSSGGRGGRLRDSEAIVV